MVEKASRGSPAPWEVIGTSSMVPSGLKLIGSMQAFLIETQPWVALW